MSPFAVSVSGRLIELTAGGTRWRIQANEAIELAVELVLLAERARDREPSAFQHVLTVEETLIALLVERRKELK